MFLQPFEHLHLLINCFRAKNSFYYSSSTRQGDWKEGSEDPGDSRQVRGGQGPY